MIFEACYSERSRAIRGFINKLFIIPVDLEKFHVGGPLCQCLRTVFSIARLRHKEKKLKELGLLLVSLSLREQKTPGEKKLFEQVDASGDETTKKLARLVLF